MIADRLIDADVEQSSSEPDNRLQPRLQPDPAGYPLGLFLAVLTGFFGGRLTSLPLLEIVKTSRLQPVGGRSSLSLHSQQLVLFLWI